MQLGMKRKIKTGILFLSVLLVLQLVGSVDQVRGEDFTIVTTFTILEDFAGEIAGSDADVRVITPIGAEVHEWELLPANFVDLEEADIVFYNGLNIEQWMDQVRAVVDEDVSVVAVGEESDYPTLPIITGDYAGDPDPHIWMDVYGAISYVETIRDALIEHNPARRETYEENAADYIQELEGLHEELVEKLAVIPEEHRILISTEAAFIYFADAYDFTHDGVWGTNTEEEGTPRQMQRILEVVLEKKPAGIFWESTGSDRYVLSIADDTDVAVFGPLYVDSVGSAGSEAVTYPQMMRANARLLVEVLAP